MKKQILFLGLCASLWSGCDILDPPPPPPSYPYKFTCKVDGNAWDVKYEPTDAILTTNSLYIDYFRNDAQLQINGRNKATNENLEVIFYLNDSTSKNYSPSAFRVNSSICGGNYDTLPNQGNVIRILEHDKNKRTVKGTFEFSVQKKEPNPTCTQPIRKITEGYFDVQY